MAKASLSKPVGWPSSVVVPGELMYMSTWLGVRVRVRVGMRVRVRVRGVGTERGVSGRRGVCSRVDSRRGISHIGSNQLEHSGYQSGVVAGRPRPSGGGASGSRRRIGAWTACLSRCRGVVVESVSNLILARRLPPAPEPGPTSLPQRPTGVPRGGAAAELGLCRGVRSDRAGALARAGIAACAG